jgi:hypothetical protein
MLTSLPAKLQNQISQRLEAACRVHRLHYPGHSSSRQPVHTVYGGAHLFKAETPRRLGQLALESLAEHAPDCHSFAEALGLSRSHLLLPNPAVPSADCPLDLVSAIYDRVCAKLHSEPVEDYRIDFEDGLGNCSWAEEDALALTAAAEVSRAFREHLLPPFIGVRIKSLREETHQRALRTLDIFLTKLLTETSGRLPDNFVVTVPKVALVEQAEIAAAVLEFLESTWGLCRGAIKLEIMVEQTQAILDEEGRCPIPRLLASAGSRCRGIHLGIYDYTASAEIAARDQAIDHPDCDFARHMLKVAIAGTGTFLADGPTALLPIGSTAEVRRAWRLAYNNTQRSLVHGYYQGWDLHPAQLPARFAATYAFFLQGLAEAGQRLRNLFQKSARATRVGAIFDDAATGEGLLNFFARAWNCGAITSAELHGAELSPTDLQTRSFYDLLRAHREGVVKCP